MKIIIRG